ncbi:PREDICTED: uncharacterized protein LOC105956874 [Erythranthe guttata]|uniref:uncharacterized protein LOC105956874 n=1 Tax=Erythranthe guttata TaxID=4155 RepID=UPI00064D828B|nr:PREDICTED: uncharacterized protein LOC105956874 [Erythranthe guttata]|eukprot:XP_012836236.1 PREDICTED: uncharacterized protein LOC105956874 [Erythranthe guttata]
MKWRTSSPDYFKTIFTSSNPSTADLDEVLEAIEPRVSAIVNGVLMEEYTAVEVKKALDGMHPLKSPGPDGFPVVFYQRFWNIIGNEVTQWVLRLLNHKEIPTAEALSALIKREERRGNIAGLAVCNAAPEASGQIVNYTKSCIAFSKKTSVENVNLICSKLNMEVVDKHDKYLGLPSGLGKSKREAFVNIRDRVCQRLQGWKEKWLSKGGKEILIKAVIQAIPTYAMSCFRLPRYFTEEIERLMAKFWWEDSQGKGVHWARWKELCKSKDFGGLGFRDLHAFNTALLAKQVWRLLVSPHSLLGRIFKARYYPHSDILGSGLGSNPSYTWRSIWGAIELVEKGSRWRIGNGAKVTIWRDKWLPRERTFKVFTPRENWPIDMKVQSLIDGNTGLWKVNMIASMFYEEDRKSILSIPIGSAINEDRLIWHYNKNGLFSVRSAYHTAVHLEQEKAGVNIASGSSLVSSRSWKWLWDLNLPNKIKIFLWRCCNNLLPTRQNLTNRKILENSLCEICGAAEEDVLHCLSLCSFARQMQRSSIKWEVPFRDEVKINVDASLASVEHGCGLGGLGRTSDGNCIAWFSTHCPLFIDPTSAEAMAALKAMEFAQNHRWSRVVLECDSSTIVAAIAGEFGSRTIYGNVIDDIKRLASTFEVFKIRHVKREANRAAHEIARLSSIDSFMSNVLPNFIIDIVKSEFPH